MSKRNSHHKPSQAITSHHKPTYKSSWSASSSTAWHYTLMLLFQVGAEATCSHARPRRNEAAFGELMGGRNLLLHTGLLVEVELQQECRAPPEHGQKVIAISSIALCLDGTGLQAEGQSPTRPQAPCLMDTLMELDCWSRMSWQGIRHPTALPEPHQPIKAERYSASIQDRRADGSRATDGQRRCMIDGTESIRRRLHHGFHV